MKNLMTHKLGLAFTGMALLLASCGSNATITKRYHNRGFNIAWGGGSSADGKNERPTMHSFVGLFKHVMDLIARKKLAQKTNSRDF